ncbi:dihydrolipoamide acetyltransferase family protein [Streptomyces sp. NPDC048845]|uniref:dihydrolipoamide acetyltransferase family protein n=1 Tax=Streptomyces sp. NPDC048845 TaxID=3155390 RepID=UPI0034225D53
MPVVREFALPDLGEGLTEAEIVRWLVEVGDVVRVDQPVVEVETAKAMVEVPCPYGGVVTARFGEEGTELPVGAALLTVAVGAEAPVAGGEAGTGGTDSGAGGAADRGGNGPGAGAAPASGGRGGPGRDGGRSGVPAADPEAEGSGNVLVGYGTAAPAARRRRVRPNGPAGEAEVRGDRESAASGGGRSGPVERDGSTLPEGGAWPPQEGPAAQRPGGAPRGVRAGGPGGVHGDGGTAAPGTAAAEPSGGDPSEAASEFWQPLDGIEGRAPGAGTARSEGAAAGRGGPDRTVTGGPVAVISPLVRRLAREHGIDLRRLAGSGPDGLILRADVERAVRSGAGGPGAAARDTRGGTDSPPAEPYAVQGPMDADPRGQSRTAVPAGHAGEARTGAEPFADAVPGSPAGAEPVAGAGPGQRPVEEAPSGDGRGLRSDRVPLRGVRGAVADKLSRSRREIPDATTWVDADATELLAARAAMNAAGGPRISLLALMARITTAALARYPELNSTVDAEAREVVRLPRIHLGFAAQTDRGLMVPVVRDAHLLDAEGLSREFARLTEAARSGRLTPAELTGGTFTLNNYGVFGVDGSTPIINHPEAAMLGVGRIVPKPWVHGGELAVRQVVQLSFTFDHRVCDGGTAGGFLRYVADCVEHPAVLLRTL